MSDNDDHVHWNDDNMTSYVKYAKPTQGYDENNGRHNYEYHPSGGNAQMPAAVYPNNSAIMYYPVYPANYTSPLLLQQEAHYWPAAYPALPYNYGPFRGGYPVAAVSNTQPHQQYMAQVQSAYYHVNRNPEPVTPTRPPANAWVGRTRAQVDEDNMKIAKAEGAYDKRKVVPVGLKDDQMVWVVEADNRTTLRAFGSVKDLKGEWKEDPRYESAWFFVVQGANK